MDSQKVVLVDFSQPVQEVNRKIREAGESYIGFFEEGAHWSDGYFEKLVDQLENHSECVMAQGKLLNRKGKPVMDRGPIPESASVLNCEDDAACVPLCVDGAVFRASFLNDLGLSFAEDMEYCRVERFMLEASKVNPLHFCDPTCSYTAKRIFDEEGHKVPQSYQFPWYRDSALPVMSGLVREDDSLPGFAQFALLRMMTRRFLANADSAVKLCFQEAGQREKYLDDVRQVLDLVDNQILINPAVNKGFPRLGYLYLGSLRTGGLGQLSVKAVKGNAVLQVERNGSLAEICKFTAQRFSVKCMNYRQEQGRVFLDIHFCFYRCFPLDSFSFEVDNVYGGESHVESCVLTGMDGGKLAYFDQEAAMYSVYRVSIPLSENCSNQEISAYASVSGQRFLVKIRFGRTWPSRLVDGNRYSFWSIPGFIVRNSKGKMQVSKAGLLSSGVCELRYLAGLKAKGRSDANIKRMADWRVQYLLSRSQFKNKRIWAYYDKGFKAGDNAEFAYRYAMAQDDGIEKVYYLDRTSPDWDRLEKDGFILLEPGSMKGILYALNAEVIYATHSPSFRKMGISRDNIRFFKGIVHPKVIRLYHGYPITKSASYTQIHDNCAGVVVGSKYEAQLYGNEENGFAPDQIIKSGMPRYDGLIDDRRRQILFAPTWRPSLKGRDDASGAATYNPKFKKSHYYTVYNSVMNHPEVLKTARETGYRLVMFLHPRLAIQSKDFVANDVVCALDCTKDTDYVTVMRQSDLMVTDYSSVMFDFGSMRKPVICFQDPTLAYWRTVDFDYETQGIGEMCYDSDHLVELLCHYMRTDCALKPEYKERMDNFYVADDHEASRRVYEETLRILGE